MEVLLKTRAEYRFLLSHDRRTVRAQSAEEILLSNLPHMTREQVNESQLISLQIPDFSSVRRPARCTSSRSFSIMPVKHQLPKAHKYARYIGEDLVVVMIGGAVSPGNAVRVEKLVSYLVRNRCQDGARKAEKIGRNLNKNFRPDGLKLDPPARPFRQMCWLD
jgi:hypothetical protein